MGGLNQRRFETGSGPPRNAASLAGDWGNAIPNALPNEIGDWCVCPVQACS
jgi:hypothetical protein